MQRWARRLVLGVLAVTVVYVGLAVIADLPALARALGRLDGRAVALAIALVLAGYTLRALRWRLYLHRVGVLWGGKGPGGQAASQRGGVLEPAGREALGFAAAFTMGMSSGKSGQAVKAYYLNLATGLDYGISIPATVAERVSDTISVLLLLVVGLALAPEADWRLALVATGAIALLLAAFRSIGLTARVLGALRGIRAVARHEAAILRSQANLRGHLTFRELAAPTVIGLSGFLFEALALQVLAERGLGLTLPFGAAALILAIADLAGVISLIPAGLGATEGSMLALLAARGIPIADATALTLVFRVCTLWLSLALGAAAAGALQWRHARRSTAARAMR